MKDREIKAEQTLNIQKTDAHQKQSASDREQDAKVQNERQRIYNERYYSYQRGVPLPDGESSSPFPPMRQGRYSVAPFPVGPDPDRGDASLQPRSRYRRVPFFSR